MHSKRRLSGAIFLLLDCDKREIMRVITDEHGEAFIDCIPYGKYYLVEASPPYGYTRYTKEIEIEIGKATPNRCVEVVNCRKTGSLNIIKSEEV